MLAGGGAELPKTRVWEACSGELVGVTHLCDSDLDSARAWVQELERGMGDLPRASVWAYCELSGVCTRQGGTVALGLG